MNAQIESKAIVTVEKTQHTVAVGCQTLSVAECAALLGVSKTLLYQETSAGRIPHVRIGGRILFHRQTIERWLAAGE